eukprot:5092434-Pyramimonas_sp.AAC.1
MSGHFKDGQGLGPQNSTILWQLIEYLTALNGMQIARAVGADLNMEVGELNQYDWLAAVSDARPLLARRRVAKPLPARGRIILNVAAG